MKNFFLALVFLTGCATVQPIEATALPKLGNGLHAVEDLWQAACLPEPLPKLEAVCANSHTGINDAVEVYGQINDAVKAAQ